MTRKNVSATPLVFKKDWQSFKLLTYNIKLKRISELSSRLSSLRTRDDKDLSDSKYQPKYYIFHLKLLHKFPYFRRTKWVVLLLLSNVEM